MTCNTHPFLLGVQFSRRPIQEEGRDQHMKAGPAIELGRRSARVRNRNLHPKIEIADPEHFERHIQNRPRLDPGRHADVQRALLLQKPRAGTLQTAEGEDLAGPAALRTGTEHRHANRDRATVERLRRRERHVQRQTSSSPFTARPLADSGEHPPVVNTVVRLGLHFSNCPRMFTAEGVWHAPAGTRQRNDREADFRCGATPWRGEPS